MQEKIVKIKAGPVLLEGSLEIPSGAGGIVIFAHGSGSSRHSPRNKLVAKTLHEGRMGTLLIDLLSPEEEKLDNKNREFRFNISLLAERLVAITDWVGSHEETKPLAIGYFGASTGAAAALIAASRRFKVVRAVVSRGGRPDLAGAALLRVRAPTLLIVGGADEEVIALNEEAFELLQEKKQLVIVPGAGHLFEERGTLEQVANFARKWFESYL